MSNADHEFATRFAKKRNHTIPLTDIEHLAVAYLELTEQLATERRARANADQVASEFQQRFLDERRATIERCANVCDKIGVDWRDAGDMTKFYATNYLVEAIRALEPAAAQVGDLPYKGVTSSTTPASAAATYTPKGLYDVAVNTLIPLDFKKHMALTELIHALEQPDAPAPQASPSVATADSPQGAAVPVAAAPAITILREAVGLFLADCSIAFGHWERQWFDRCGQQEDDKPEREPSHMLRCVDAFRENIVLLLADYDESLRLEAELAGMEEAAKISEQYAIGPFHSIGPAIKIAAAIRAEIERRRAK